MQATAACFMGTCPHGCDDDDDDDDSKGKHSKAGAARVSKEFEASRIGPLPTIKVTRSASGTVQGVMTRAQSRAK